MISNIEWNTVGDGYTISFVRDDDTDTESDADTESDTETMSDTESDTENDDVFHCPECNCELTGDDANDFRTWVATVCDCGNHDPECDQCGYDVCMDCEAKCEKRDGRRAGLELD
jgi:hypothetical protein